LKLAAPTEGAVLSEEVMRCDLAHSRFCTVTLALIIACVVTVPAIVYLGRERLAAERSAIAAAMDQVYMALCNYAEVHGNLPPVDFCDENDHAIYSWRFGVLPFLESDLAGADFELGWDQAQNARWRNSAPHVFCFSPFALETGCTNLAAVTGIGTAFDANSGPVRNIVSASRKGYFL
jgi:hypothetical protein